jgi:hypothetical protein
MQYLHNQQIHYIEKPLTEGEMRKSENEKILVLIFTASRTPYPNFVKKLQIPQLNF